MWLLEWSLQQQRHKNETERSPQGSVPYAGFAIACSSLDITARWKSWFSLWFYVPMFNLVAAFISGTSISITVYIYFCFQHHLLKRRLGWNCFNTRKAFDLFSSFAINSGLSHFSLLDETVENKCDVTSFCTFVPGSIRSKDIKIKRNLLFWHILFLKVLARRIGACENYTGCRRFLWFLSLCILHVEARSVYSEHKNATTLFPSADLTEKNWRHEFISPQI
jgi:hypothetical protein